MTSEQKNKIFQVATNCIEIEANAILKLKDSINEDFINAVFHIFKSSGRLVITGIGKSAIVGQKIVSTLNSTGTPSLFMHAADAIHGDLGMIQQEDIICCISKSGETEEIKVLIPLVRSFGTKLIAIVSNRNSFLAKQADFILWTPIEKEADPNNLAPTASTTSQMAIGDAIAVALLSLKGFSPEDFALFHPGGSLGKQLYLTVSNMVNMHPKPTVGPDANLKEVILEMTTKRLGMTAVVNKENQILGIITDGDLRRMLEKSTNIQSLFAKDIMTEHPKTIASTAMAVHAISMMREFNITQLIVEKENTYLGVVHLHDLLKEGLT